MYKSILALLMVVLFSGCAILGATISSDPVKSVAERSRIGQTVIGGLQNAAYNLDSAIAIGILEADDPAAACVHSILKKAGVEKEEGAEETKSFDPKVSELISAGSVLYIRAQQAKKINRERKETSVGCRALIGTFVIDAARAGIKILPGGGLLN